MSNSDYYEPITMDELFELKELSAKLMKFTEKELAYRQDISYENFDYTPRSISAFNRAVIRRECDQIPFPNTWEFIDSLPLDEESVAKFEGRKQLHKYLSLNVIKFVVRLYYISGMTQREIAAHVGPRNIGHQWAQSTVNSRLKALRKIVRQHLRRNRGKEYERRGGEKLIYRLWCSRHRDFHEVEQSKHPTLVKSLMEDNSGCDGRYYYWTGENNKILDVPIKSVFPLRRRNECR